MSIQQPIQKTKEIVKKLPSTKPHFELIGAILTIPVLLTVILLNIINLQKINKPTDTASAASPVPTKSVDSTTNGIYHPYQNVTAIPVSSAPTPATSSSQTCQPTIGPLSIASPQEGQTINNNPVCIDISYNGAGYCGVVWAYRINQGPWSDYSSNSVCLYNLPSGQITFELSAKSLSSSSSQTLVRTFLYQGSPTSTPTSTSNATNASASSPTPTSNTNTTPTLTTTPQPAAH